MTLSLHHVALSTRNLEASISWFVAFLEGSEAWRTESFSELTQTRVPGIRRMAEIRSGNLRVHIFEAPNECAVSRVPGEHYAIVVTGPDELRTLHERWIALAEEYDLASSGSPSPIVVDSYGIESFYARDITGVEFEVTHEPPDEE